MKKLLKTLETVIVGNIVIIGVLTILYFVTELLSPEPEKPVIEDDEDDDDDYFIDFGDLEDID